MNKKAQKSLIEKHKNKIKSFTHSIVYLSLFMLFLFLCFYVIKLHIILYKFETNVLYSFI